MELLMKDVVRKSLDKGVLPHSHPHSYLTSTPKDATNNPVLLVHGAGGAGWEWMYFVPYLAERGKLKTYAPDIRGHDTLSGESMLTLSVMDYFEHMADFIVRRIIPVHERLPIIIGHSMGGIIAQKLAEQGLARMVILVASVPPSGIDMKVKHHLAPILDILSAGYHNVLSQPFHPSIKLIESLFVEPKKSKDMIELCHKKGLIESPRVIRELLGSQISVDKRKIRVPMLVIGAENDTIIPPEVVLKIGGYYKTVPTILSHLGHMCPLEYGWERVASLCLKWIQENSTSTPRT
jgi:pimeloyl-ACP methyl ester carboxylesterase